MERRLQARSISVIVYDEEMPLRYRAFDLMHFTHQGHAIIAAALLPRVMEILDRRRSAVLPRRNATRPAAAQDFRSAKALFVPSLKRDIVRHDPPRWVTRRLPRPNGDDPLPWYSRLLAGVSAPLKSTSPRLIPRCFVRKARRRRRRIIDL
jgi:hypothetical protein